MKSEPDEVSVDDALAAPDQTVAWTGVRKYQARNLKRDMMRLGDGVLFYHSSCPQPGIAGIAEVASTAYPDPTQFDKKSPYYDPKSDQEQPRWMLVDVKVTQKTQLIALSTLREYEELADMILLRKGNRLSVMPVTTAEWQFIAKKLAKKNKS